jgi:Restriction endonuclease
MLDFKELPPDGISFEQLIRELCIRSGFEVHWTGVGPDGGRDLVIAERADGPLAPFERRWLISCKHQAHSGRSVALEEVRDISDACRAVDATGFLLACSTQPSSAVVRRLEELRTRGDILTTYWDGIEIERRLDTPATFPLITLFFPVSARARPWRIYNTDSPSFWAANYKDYFVYLSSRTANTFPSLEEVETIIHRLESVPLPPGEDWQRHILRPRAIYFDNKHENFVVFGDYLFPHDKGDEVVTLHEINRILRDGEGLHRDGMASWYPTFWDIRMFLPCR